MVKDNSPWEMYGTPCIYYNELCINIVHKRFNYNTFYFSDIVSKDQLIYVIGGMIDGTTQKSVNVYDVMKKEWKPLCDMKTGRYWHRTTLFENKIYAVGGWNNEGGYNRNKCCFILYCLIYTNCMKSLTLSRE